MFIPIMVLGRGGDGDHTITVVPITTGDIHIGVGMDRTIDACQARRARQVFQGVILHCSVKNSGGESE